MGKAANVDNCVFYYCVVEYNLIMTTKKYCYSTYCFYHVTDKTAHMSIDFSCGAKELNFKLETVLPCV